MVSTFLDAAFGAVTRPRSVGRLARTKGGFGRGEASRFSRPEPVRIGTTGNSDLLRCTRIGALHPARHGDPGVGSYVRFVAGFWLVGQIQNGP